MSSSSSSSLGSSSSPAMGSSSMGSAPSESEWVMVGPVGESVSMVRPCRVTLSEIARDAAAQPLENVQRARWYGRALLVLMRPRQLILGPALREGWKLIDLSGKINQAVALGCNAFTLVRDTCRLGRAAYEKGMDGFLVELGEVSKTKDVAEEDVKKYQFPMPSAKALGEGKETLERLNHKFGCVRVLRGCGSIGVDAVNALSMRLSNQSLLTPVDVRFDSEWQDFVLGDGSGEYRCFARRVEERLFLSLGLERDLIDLPKSSAELEGIPVLKVITNDIYRVLSNTFKRVFTDHRSQKLRIDFVKAVEAFVLKMMLDGVYKKIPERDFLIKEISICQLLNLISLPDFNLGRINRALGNWQSLLSTDLIHSIGRGVGSIPTGCMKGIKLLNGVQSNSLIGELPYKIASAALRGVTTAALSAGVEHSPLAYTLFYRELNRWSALGDQRLEELGSVEGLKGLLLGKSEAPRAQPRNPHEVVDQMGPSLLKIMVEFTLGTLLRMGQDERLGDKKGLVGLLRLVIKNTIDEFLNPAPSAAVPAAAAAPAEPAPELPGSREVKEAFKRLMQESWEIFREAFATELEDELVRQGKSADEAFQVVKTVRNDFFHMEGRFVQWLTRGLISVEGFVRVAEAPGRLGSSAVSAISNLRRRSKQLQKEEEKDNL